MGLWWEDKWRPVISAVVNLVVNIILVNKIGIAGVIISTFVCSVFISTPWGNIVLFKNYFKKGLGKYFAKLAYNYFVTFIICVGSFLVCEQIPVYGFMAIIVRGIVCCILPNILLFIFYFKSQEYMDAKEFIIGIVNRKLKKQ